MFCRLQLSSRLHRVRRDSPIFATPRDRRWFVLRQTWSKTRLSRCCNTNVWFVLLLSPPALKMFLREIWISANDTARVLLCILHRQLRDALPTRNPAMQWLDGHQAWVRVLQATILFSVARAAGAPRHWGCSLRCAPFFVHSHRDALDQDTPNLPVSSRISGKLHPHNGIPLATNLKGENCVAPTGRVLHAVRHRWRNRSGAQWKQNLLLILLWDLPSTILFEQKKGWKIWFFLSIGLYTPRRADYCTAPKIVVGDRQIVVLRSNGELFARVFEHLLSVAQ